MDKVDGHAALAQGRKGIGDGVMERIGVIVANPEFKQIPQHIEGIGTGGVALQKAHQGGRHVGPIAAQVNVTDKEGAHDGVQGALITGWLEKVAGWAEGAGA